jgi:cell wall-associated NlpC family hydrolase
MKTRAAVAAVTTGTVAVSGAALAGCAQGALPADSSADDPAVTSPISLATAVAKQVPDTALRNLAVTASLTTSSSVADARLPAGDIAAPALAGKADVGLRTTTPDVTVEADTPVQIGFKLFDEDTGAPLANQLIKIQVKLPEKWATFKHLTTDASGYAGYDARVLTTTQVTAVFDGTDALQSAKSDDVALMRVRPKPVALPVQASRDNARDALPADPGTSSAPAPAPAPAGSSLGGKAVYLASQQAGKPYVYGAEGPYSFDCSGLVQYVYGNLGKSLPRTAQAQYDATTKVSQYNKQPGDLIFFGSPGGIYHVAVYAGDGKIWVARHSGTVVSLQDIWTTSYLVTRVF